MFWKKKERQVTYDGLEVVLSKREAFNRFTGEITNRFLAYRQGDEWRGLVGYEQFTEELNSVNKKLELILDEMGLVYQPETEKKEPACLVKKYQNPFKDMSNGSIWPYAVDPNMFNDSITSGQFTVTNDSTYKDTSNTCKCGFKAKNARGLSIHKSKCRK